jgi:hypothetical protein
VGIASRASSPGRSTDTPESRHAAESPRTGTQHVGGFERTQLVTVGARIEANSDRAPYFTVYTLIGDVIEAGRNPTGTLVVSTVAVAVPFSKPPVCGVSATLHDDVPLHDAVTGAAAWTIVVNLPVVFWV